MEASILLKSRPSSPERPGKAAPAAADIFLPPAATRARPRQRPHRRGPCRRQLGARWGGSLHIKLRGPGGRCGSAPRGPGGGEAGEGAAPRAHPPPAPGGRWLPSPPAPRPRPDPRRACSASPASGTARSRTMGRLPRPRAQRTPRDRTGRSQAPWPGSAAPGSGGPARAGVPRYPGRARGRRRRSLGLRDFGQLRPPGVAPRGSRLRGPGRAPPSAPRRDAPEPRRSRHCPGAARGGDPRARAPAPRPSPGTSAAGS